MKSTKKLVISSLVGCALIINSVTFGEKEVMFEQATSITPFQMLQENTFEVLAEEIQWDVKENTESKILPRYTQIEEYEPNNTSTQAYNSGNRIMPNRWKSGTLSAISDNVDFYYFENDSYGYVNFAIFDVMPNTGLRADIYNSNMEHQAGAKIVSSLGTSFYSNSLPIGRYYIKVSVDGASSGSYRVRVDKR